MPDSEDPQSTEETVPYFHDPTISLASSHGPLISILYRCMATSTAGAATESSSTVAASASASCWLLSEHASRSSTVVTTAAASWASGYSWRRWCCRQGSRANSCSASQRKVKADASESRREERSTEEKTEERRDRFPEKEGVVAVA